MVALYAELNEKADFLQHASELKSRFLSNMSHEFRTPLNSITALGQILLDRLDGDLSPEQEKQVRYICNSARDLTELVNDLLDLAKVEAGKVSIRPSNFHVSSVFAALRGMLRPLLSQNSSVSLTFEEPEGCPELFSDEAKVSQILGGTSSATLSSSRNVERCGSRRRPARTKPSFSPWRIPGLELRRRIRNAFFRSGRRSKESCSGRSKEQAFWDFPSPEEIRPTAGRRCPRKKRAGSRLHTFYAVIPTNFGGETELVAAPELKQEIDAKKFPVLIVEDNPEALFIYEKYFRGTRFQLIPAKTLKEARQALRQDFANR